jgi:hypothetical protein
MASSEITIELGDFVKIISPTKAMYHLKTFLVEYIDDDIIEVIDVANGDKFQLDLYDDGRIIDEQILAIHLLSRSPEPGYARIHKLLPGLWINIEFEDFLDEHEARDILREAPGIMVIDKREAGGYITPIECVGDYATYISRIRQDSTIDNGINLWCVSDNLRKGAALNAVQIAELLGRRHLKKG